MLEERIRALAMKSSAAQFADMDEPLATRVNEWKAKMRGNGRMFLYIARTYEDELRARAQVIWRNLQRAHSSFGAPHTGGTLRNDLFNSLREQLDAAVATLAPRLDKDMAGVPSGFPYQKNFGDVRDRELAKHDAEIEHYVASLDAAAARGSPTGGDYHFYGAVGAVMTGPSAFAKVDQHIGQDQQREMLRALELARDAIAAAASVPAKDKAELLEIVEDTAREAQRERPNTRRLSQALQDIAATVQGIANGLPAYEAIRAVANAIGIPL
jgi:hypothetical protein